jgi:hypothetical protein
MRIDLINQYKFQCKTCLTRCDGYSKSAFIFEDDTALAEKTENWLVKHLIRLGLCVRKAPPQEHGLPDIEIIHGDEVIGRVEVKAQGRAFMAVERLLPGAGLLPYETVVLNLSDLERYIALFKTERKPTYIVWAVKRPCLGKGFWGQDLETLEKILLQYGERRRFRRESTRSDVVNGIHKGVTVNYHFSLRELLPLEELDPVFQNRWSKP